MEQIVNIENGNPKPRSLQVLEKLAAHLPRKGWMLDVGCGNGAMLKSANKVLPGWELAAYDVSEHCKKEIEALPGVARFETSLDDFSSNQFDLIVLWHVLEHVPQPTELLTRLRSLLKPEGHLLIQVPDLDQNPFDLGVFDHVSHFSKLSLETLLGLTGFRVGIDGNEWIPNCLTLCSRKAERNEIRSTTVSGEPSKTDPLTRLNTILEAFELSARTCAGKYVVFGSSQAALLTYQQASLTPHYFIDEDSSRIDQLLYDIQVKGPEQIDRKMLVLMPFSKARAVRLGERLVKEQPHLSLEQFVSEPSNATLE
jgi:ubiquinone/menaquinone biosynthesis C-methylase UbiE